MRKKYYVSVQSKNILENQGDTPYEFEIEASPNEVEELKLIFEKMGNADHSAYWRTHIPGVPYHHDRDNDVYDSHMKEAYQLIYNVGTQETKDHISSMNIID